MFHTQLVFNLLLLRHCGWFYHEMWAASSSSRQKPQQWEALREHYPMLYDQMRMMAHELDWKPHKGDQTPERFRRYWCGTELIDRETPTA